MRFLIENEFGSDHRYHVRTDTRRDLLGGLTRGVRAVFKGMHLDQLTRLKGVGKLQAKLITNARLPYLKDRIQAMSKRAQIGALFTC